MNRRARIVYLQERIDINTRKAMKLFNINKHHQTEIEKHMDKLHHRGKQK